jgi:hypothetical protein
MTANQLSPRGRERTCRRSLYSPTAIRKRANAGIAERNAWRDLLEVGLFPRRQREPWFPVELDLSHGFFPKCPGGVPARIKTAVDWPDTDLDRTAQKRKRSSAFSKRPWTALDNIKYPSVGRDGYGYSPICDFGKTECFS